MTMNTSPSRRFGVAARLSAVAVGVALTLAACGTDNGGGGTDEPGGSGDSTSAGPAGSVPAGATKEQYREALASIDPISFNTQVPGGPDSPANARFVQWMKAVEDWSDGKVAFEIAYSDSIVPPAEVGPALSDGRLDVGSLITVYTPDTFPANQLLSNATVSGRTSPFIGTMHVLGLANDLFFQVPELRQELEGQDVHVIAGPLADGQAHMFCTQPKSTLADFKGAESTASNKTMPAIFDKLGITAVSLTFPEYYESLQRGVVDCVATSGIAGQLSGIVEQAPYVTTIDEGTFAASAAVLSINKDLWEGLPLPVQQLMHDRLDVMFTAGLEAGMAAWNDLFGTIEAKGKFQSMAPDAQAAFLQGTAAVLDELKAETQLLNGADLAEKSITTSEKWSGILGELGYTDPDYANFTKWYADGGYDYTAFVEKFMEEVYGPQRPS